MGVIMFDKNVLVKDLVSLNYEMAIGAAITNQEFIRNINENYLYINRLLISNKGAANTFIVALYYQVKEGTRLRLNTQTAAVSSYILTEIGVLLPPFTKITADLSGSAYPTTAGIHIDGYFVAKE